MPAVTVTVSRLDYAIAFWRTSMRHPVNLFLFGMLGTLMKWGGVRSVQRTRGFIYVRVTRASAHVIPRRCFPDAAADDEFWNALQPLVAKKNS